LLRFVGDDGAFITTEDHGQQFGLPEPVDAEAEISKRLLGKIITAVELQLDTGDLMLFIEDGRLETLFIRRL